MTEQATTNYIHHVPGRLRVRSALVKRDAAAAERVRDMLRSQPGGKAVLSLLDGHGHLRPAAPGSIQATLPESNPLAEKIGTAVGTILLEKLVERSATALI